jgi:hypothetical protein
MSTPGFGDETELSDEGAAPAPSGYFAEISFFGHISHVGYVTEVTFHGGEPGYRIDLPELLWGGNPVAYREYAASAMFSRWPVEEASVRIAWKAERKRAEEWRQREAVWAGERTAALTAGPAPGGACTCDVSDDGGTYEADPACPIHGTAPLPF